jgi:hypothetical protein
MTNQKAHGNGFAFYLPLGGAAMIKERLQTSDLRALQVLRNFSTAQLNKLSRNMKVVM